MKSFSSKDAILIIVSLIIFEFKDFLFIPTKIDRTGTKKNFRNSDGTKILGSRSRIIAIGLTAPWPKQFKTSRHYKIHALFVRSRSHGRGYRICACPNSFPCSWDKMTCEMKCPLTWSVLGMKWHFGRSVIKDEVHFSFRYEVTWKMKWPSNVLPDNR